MRIIAIDDEKGALKVLSRAIEMCEPDADIYTFNLAKDAENFFATNGADVVFMDIQMPGIIGTDLARKFKEIDSTVNIIFTTGYEEYAVEAFDMHASGYIMKPASPEDVRKELDNLRNPVESVNTEKGIRMKTFGNFDMFVDGKPVIFKRRLAKETLAYLVDRRGSTVNRKELASVIFEDDDYSRATQSYITQIIRSMQNTLKEEHAEDILIVEYNAYAVDITKFTCDAYEYFKGDTRAINEFHGEYMKQFSWAEYSLGQFE